MDSIPEELAKSYPARKQQIIQLWNLYGQEDEPFVDALYIFGCTSTGKTSIVRSLFEKLPLKHAFVDLTECYSTKVFLEKILNTLAGHKIDPRNPHSFARCDNLMDFIYNLQNLAESNCFKQLVIILDKAERLKSMDHNLFPSFMRLRELAELEISVIFISELPFEKFYGFAQADPVKMFFPQYSREHLIEILMLDYEQVRETISSGFSDGDFLTPEFYRGYLNLFLSVFYRACTDVSELRHNARLNFVSYCKPIFQKDCNPTDSLALWRHIAPTLKASLEVLYLRIANTEEEHQSPDNKQLLNFPTFNKENLAPSVELPFYAKYLLISAYLASYNSPKDDKRLFMKFHGKKRKSKKDMNQKNKVYEKLNTQLGPKAFNLDRLMAIFYAILDEKVGFNHNILVQVTTLVELQLLLLVSESSGIEGHKYKCNVGFDFIQSVSKMVGLNIRKYLTDFN